MAMKNRSKRKKVRQAKELARAQEHAIDKQLNALMSRQQLLKGLNYAFELLPIALEGGQSARDLNELVKSFLDYIERNNKQVLFVITSMQQAVATGATNNVVELLEQILALSAEIEIKQKPVLQQLNTFSERLKEPAFSFGCQMFGDVLNISRTWDKIAALAQTLENNCNKSLMLARDYLITQSPETLSSLDDRFTVGDDIMIC